MGRAFEYRKARKLKRWGNMSRTFTKIGKEITIAVKAAGPDPAGNSRLRVLLQNAKAANMPKDTVERAIKKATDKDASDYKEIVYEGYGPFGIAIVVETATDNNTRTVANVRSYFNKFGGSLGTSGSLSFLFDHKCVFKVAPKEGVDLEELELELIDFGVDEVENEGDELLVALAGPLSNALLALAAALIGYVLLPLLAGQAPMSLLYSLFSFFMTFIVVNLSLAFFNLIPLPPLDGSSILVPFLKGKALREYYRIQQYAMPILLVILYLLPTVLHIDIIGMYFDITVYPLAQGLTSFMLGAI